MPSPQQTTIENLPIEVLPDIFIRLLAKQLAQMRSVCKPWNALLSESSFVKSHLQSSKHHNDEILLFFHQRILFLSSFAACASHSPNVDLTNSIKLPVNRESIISYARVYAIISVNGLICLNCESSNEDVIQIWNPSLSAVFTLPPISVPSRNSTKMHFGFGYDPKSDDYKVVKLTRLSRPFRMLPEVEVYSMRKGSWELITQSFPSHIKEINDEVKVCVDGHDGHLHWLGYTDFRCDLETIVAFDLGAETFQEISLPDSVMDQHRRRTNVLGVMGGKLCVMTKVYGGECEVWVMNEYGVAESWVKHHVFSQFVDIAPLGFTLQNKFLFEGKDHSFGLYDPVVAEGKTFKIGRREWGKIKMAGYVDSLVWVAPTNH